jgi:hypothetical protein
VQLTQITCISLLPFLLIVVPLYGFVLPSIAMVVEVTRYSAEWEGYVMDNFEMAYTFLRFSEYWALGVVQIGVNARYKK